MSIHTQLIDKFKNKSGIISIIGLGYVGLPLMLRFAEVGCRVIGVDIDTHKINALNKHESYIQHIPSERLKKVSAFIEATTDFSKIVEADAIILCVPTPLNKYREPDLSYVINTVDAIVPYIRPGQLISLESTTYPGTTEEELQPRLESTGHKVGQDIFLVFSPEREDPGNAHYTTATIPKVCGGVTPACLKAGITLYESIIEKIVPVSSTRAAEMTKLLENIHRAVNIGLVNEMKILSDKMKIDIHEVIDAAATKPFGFVPYHPGPGIGGHCIPIDPFYLTWKAREYGMHTRFIELAGEINNSMPYWVVNKITMALNDRSKSIKNSHILICGIAYKKNVDDMRESPSLVLMEVLSEKGAKLSYSDPHVPKIPPMREHHFKMESTELTAENLKQFDCVVIATAHSKFDYDLIRKHAKLIVDTRGVYHLSTEEHIVKA